MGGGLGCWGQDKAVDGEGSRSAKETDPEHSRQAMT